MATRREGPQARSHILAEAVEEKSPGLSSWIEESAEETLPPFERPHRPKRKKLRTTNGIEHAEIRRRSRVVRIQHAVA